MFLPDIDQWIGDLIRAVVEGAVTVYRQLGNFTSGQLRYWATTLVQGNYRYWTTTLVLGNYWYWNKSNCRYQWATIPLLGNYTGEQQPSPPLTLFYTGGQLHHWATTLVGNYTGTRATIDTNVGNYTGKQQPLPPLTLFLFHWQEKLIEEPFSCPNPTIGIDQLPFLSKLIQINF